MTQQNEPRRRWNDILDFSKIEAGKMELEYRDFDLRATAQDVVELLARPAQSKGIEVILSVAHDLPVHVHWECEAESVASGAAALECLDRALAQQRPFDIVLSDAQMPGMTGTMLSRQIKRRPECAHLPVVLLTSAGHNGTGDKPAAADFVACLAKPIRQRDLYQTLVAVLDAGGIPAASVPAPEPGPPPLAQQSPESLPRGGRVLLAEDNAVNQKLAIHLLQRIGFTTEVVCNGYEAFDAFVARPYDLILMDVQMPDQDGFAATEQIRNYEASRGGHVPIVAVTAGALTGDRERCLAAGMDDYTCGPADGLRGIGVDRATALTQLSVRRTKITYPASKIKANENHWIA